MKPFSKKIILLVLLVFTCMANAQEREPVKITISHAIGGNSWGNAGPYSKEELVEITRYNGEYYLSKYLKITHSAGEDGKTFFKDTSSVAIRKKHLSKKDVYSLMAALNHSEDNFTSAYIRPHLFAPTKKQILQVAHELDDDDDFNKEYTDSPDAEIRKIQAFDKFDRFVDSVKPDTTYNAVTVVDAWNSFKIEVAYDNATERYVSAFLGFNSLQNPLGQPFQMTKPEFRKSIVNLKINLILQQLLPGNSLIQKQISLNAIVPAYIKWYIENVVK